MRCAANFEVSTDVSVVSDESVLKITDPRGAFEALIRNIPRSEFTVPFLLSVHVYFDTESLVVATDVAEEHLATCLNILALTTGSRFRKHRIRQIVDADPEFKGASRDVRLWSERIQYEDPQPFLTHEHVKTIERLLEFDVPPAIRRALRWYRLGIDADSPDDQFTYFWFAIEIVAEFQKSVARVNNKCPHCQSALYCERCGTHPKHRPYAKQAIAALLSEVGCDDATVALLDKTRNSLMHGLTLREIEGTLPNPHEHVVDVLGNLLCNALLKQFPHEMLDDSLVFGIPSTYLHYHADAVAHMQTMVPLNADGYFDLSFSGFKVSTVPFGPPQSASPSTVRMTNEQAERLAKLSHRKGEHQEMLVRIGRQVKEINGQLYALVLSTDMTVIKREMDKGEPGEWQDLFREFFDTARPING